MELYQLFNDLRIFDRYWRNKGERLMPRLKIDLTPYGRKLLLTVKDKILAEPEYFHMDHWFGRDVERDHDPRGYCGTTACIAGHCMWWAGLGNDSDIEIMRRLLETADIPEDVRETLREGVGAWDSVASVLLTGKKDDLWSLWYASTWPEPFKSEHYLARKDKDHRRMARIAANRIDHLLIYGE